MILGALQDLELDFNICCGSLPTQGVFYDSLIGNCCLFGEVCFSYPMKMTWCCYLAGCSVAFCFREVFDVV